MDPENTIDSDIDAALNPELSQLPDSEDFDAFAEDDESSDVNAGGGDIDDDESNDNVSSSILSIRQRREQELHEATTLREQWRTAYSGQENKFKDAQEKFRAYQKRVADGEEDLNADTQLDLQNAVMDARYELNKMKDGLDQAERYYDAKSNAPKLSPAAEAWIEANPRFESDEKFSRQASRVMEKLRSQGLDPTHQEFYRKVDAELRRKTPMGTNRPRSAAAGASRGRKSDEYSEGSDRITNKEAAFLTRIGLNPAKKEVRAEWRKNLNQAMSQAGRRR